MRPAPKSVLLRWKAVKHWSLTSLREKLVKIGAKIVTHARYIKFQMAEVAVPSRLFGEILRIDRSAGTTTGLSPKTKMLQCIMSKRKVSLNVRRNRA